MTTLHFGSCFVIFLKQNEQTTTKKQTNTQQTQIALKSVQNTNPSKHMPYNSHTSNEVQFHIKDLISIFSLD